MGDIWGYLDNQQVQWKLKKMAEDKKSTRVYLQWWTEKTDQLYISSKLWSQLKKIDGNIYFVTVCKIFYLNCRLEIVSIVGNKNMYQRF